MRRFLLPIAILVWSAAGAATARTWQIAPDGMGDAPTIQAGIDSAAAGDTVALADGTFMGDGNRDIDFLGKGIVVRSAAGDPSGCFIDCEGSSSDRHRAFMFQNLETEASVLEGVTIRNGWGPSVPPDIGSGGGAIAFLRASPRIRNCAFESNTSAYGGALYAWDFSAPRISGCLFVSNHANNDGGAVYLHSYCHPLIEDSDFRDNTGGNGGALMAVDSSSPTVDGCTFTTNGAAIYGGAVFCQLFSTAVVRECTFMENRARHGGGLAAFSSTPTVTACEFRENHAEMKGGGIICISASHASIGECLFSGNDAGEGGGLACWSPDSAPTVTGCTFLENRATHGGGIWASNSSPTLLRCVLRGNQASDLGGGIMCREGARPTIEGCLIDANSGNRGGALACWNVNTLPGVLGCTFHGNSSPNGSGIYCSESWAEIERTIITGGVGDQAVVCAATAPPPVFVCSDLFGNAGGDWTVCIADQQGVNGNFSADPLFCDAGGGDFTLHGDSSCLPGYHPNGDDCGTIGAFGEGCGSTSTRHTSWGGVKSLFR